MNPEAALKEIASYNPDELRGWGEDNAADMVGIARAAVDPPYGPSDDEPRMGKGWAESSYGAPEPGYERP